MSEGRNDSGESIGSFQLSDEIGTFSAYAYPATFGGITDFIKAYLHNEWPLDSAKPLLESMLTWLERKTGDITGKPDSRNHQDKKETLKNFRRSLKKCLSGMGETEPGDSNKKLMLNLFEVGVYCGIMAAMLEEDFSFLKDELHSKKCCEGVVNNRWMEYREDYQAAEAEALKYWQNGGQEYHHTLAKKLSLKYRLSYQTLKSKLVQVAKPFNKAFGFKK